MQKQDLPVNDLISSNPPKPSLIKCECYTSQAKTRHYKPIFSDTHLNKQRDTNKINKTTVIIHIVVMNNDNVLYSRSNKLPRDANGQSWKPMVLLRHKTCGNARILQNC